MGGTGSDFSRRSLSNLVTEAVYVVFAAVIGLVMVPYYVGELGMSAYAIVPLATSVTSYVMIVADAFCSSVNRYLVVSLERDSREEVSVVFGTSMFSVLRIAVMVLPAMMLLAYLSPMVFDISGSSATSVRVLFMTVLVSALVVAVGSCFNNALVSCNKLYSINIARISYLVIQVVMVLVMFRFGVPRLEYIGLAYLIASTSYLILSYILMRRDFPWLRVSLGKRDGGYLRDMDRLSVWTVLNRLGSLLSLQASLIVANIMLGTYEEGSLSLAVSLVSMIGTACLAVTNVFNPFLFRHYADGDMTAMGNTCAMGARFLSLALAMPLAFVSVFSPEILTAWVGPEYVFLEDVIVIMFLFLTMQSAMSVLEVVPTITLGVRGLSVITLSFGALNVSLALLLCVFTDLGMKGVAVAWTVSATLRSCVAVPMYVSGELGMRYRRLFSVQAVGMVLFTVSCLFLYLLSDIVTVPTDIPSLAVMFLAIYIVYMLVAFRVVFRKDERVGMLALMPAGISKVMSRLI